MPDPAEIVSAELVAAWGKFSLPEADSPERTLLDLTISATVGHVTDHYRVPTDPEAWTDTQRLGLMMQIVRFWKRRDTPQGVEMFGDNGVVTVTKLDNDIERLLQPRVIFG